MKQSFKSLRKLYWNMYTISWKTFSNISPVLATKVRYKLCMGKKLNLSHPKTLNEKMQWLKLYTYRNNPIVMQCSDKYTVREFVTKKGCESVLNPLFNVWDSVDDIDWGALPTKFVLKCNHGSGGNIICQDKSKLDIEDAKRKLKTWMKDDFGSSRAELSYKGIPRKIICEQYIETQDGKPPKDYKIFCSYGEPKLVFVASDRYDGHTKFDYYTPEWEWIAVKNGHPNSEKILSKPTNYVEMLNIARMLTKEFPIVRCDLYNENGKIIFGELTFLHFGGVTPFDPEKYDRIFGDMFELPIE